VLYAFAAGAIPVPLLDIAAIAAVQVDLVRALARVYEAEFDDATGKALVTSVLGASAARIGASALKAVPGFGLVPGAVLMAGMAGASTYAMGHLFRAHFEDRGTLRTFNPEALRSKYEALVEKGRALMRDLRAPEHSVEARTDLLERLARLRADQVLSEAEYDHLRSEVLSAPPNARD
jgi:uncharacterized protein (DUF697 family)